MISRRLATTIFLTTGVVVASGVAGVVVAKDNETLLQKIKDTHQLSDDQVGKLRAIFERSGFISQGNPAVTKHPMSPEECQAKVKAAGVSYDEPSFDSICGARFMAPLYDPKTEKAKDAKACIDRFEYPSMPCDYPVVWARADEAAEICEVMGKRLCDAHEWEGACAGSLEAPDYPFEALKGLSPGDAQKKMRTLHNNARRAKKSWAYGKEFKTGVCAQASTKDVDCNGGNWKKCGSNTYPSGAFPDCASELKVYDLHGNAAEHMNLPLNAGEMASAGSKSLGHTEMKGSWFIWDKFQAHEDWCRWRAPYWHGSKVRDRHSHHNYHLGFRCCKTLGQGGP